VGSLSLYFQKLQHKCARFEKATEAAKLLMEPGTKHHKVFFDELTDIKQNYESVLSIIKRIVKDNQLENDQSVV